ncbi:hypothetical protein [Kushneria indalinina]|uniref:Uncharacterized protein n=1 Tax=Kushneria indalinina DSM 14324 TaxID=1122140 RepID=A0A3D9E2C4_9GAMM|nr:hypothetical protein [Kushneria indalinina]REC96659.1 hypothetical protein C8D72_0016 [Kushneria indalinina DSM 14324]
MLSENHMHRNRRTWQMAQDMQRSIAAGRSYRLPALTGRQLRALTLAINVFSLK